MNIQNFRNFLIVLFFLICNPINAIEKSKQVNKIISFSTSPNDRYEFSFTEENGNFLFKQELRKCYGFYSDVAVVILMNWDYAILDREGNISTKTFLQLGQRFSEGKNFAKFQDSTTGVVDAQGNILFKIDVKSTDGYLDATDFYADRAIIKNSETTYALIDDKGNIIKIFNNISYPRYFSCGLSLVQIKVNNKTQYNYLNTEGNFISKINFDEAHDFENDYALVKSGCETFYINTDGVWVK